MKAVAKDGRYSINFTGFVGALDIAYSDLVRVFGKPNRGRSADDKVECEWVLRTPVGVATIYNYKDGIGYLGVVDGLPVSKIRDWHIGGRAGSGVLDHVVRAIADFGSVSFSVTDDRSGGYVGRVGA